MADLLMPKLGLTMTEGLLSAWHVAPGAAFSAGDVLYTVETEKVANEVEAEADGVIAELLAQAGDTIPVGAPVARLAGEGGAPAPAPAPAPAEQAEDPSPAPAARAAAAPRVKATPLARRIAKAEGVDLSAVKGSGAHGRIKVRDVKAAIPAASGAPAAAGVREIIPDAARSATARRVGAAKRDIPHFYVSDEVELSALDRLRAELNADEGRPRISVTHMLIRAVGLVLAEAPHLNRIWMEDRILAFDGVDVGMVAETPEGLRIPVIRDAGRASLDDIAAQARDLTERAREGRLTPADMGDGTIAISNVGMFGVTALTPIINPPNAMILGVGGERQVFRPDADGAPALRREMNLTLACDHRVIDGADGARLLHALVGALESPIRLLRGPRAAR